jgi:CBS domain-containing protein
MHCSEIMKSNPICLSAASSVLEAARLMRDQNIGFVPVCDSTGKVLGTVTDRDIAVRLVASQLPGDTQLAEIMTNEVVACRAEDEVDRAGTLMEQNRKSRILIVDDDGRLTGVVSLSDLARTGDASRTLSRIASREAHP